MVTGDELKRARGRLRLTQSGLADMLGVSRRTVAEWEASGELSETIAGRLSGVFADSLPSAPDVPPLAGVSDLELVTEMGRRLASLRSQIQGAASDRSGVVVQQPDESGQTLHEGEQIDHVGPLPSPEDAYPSDGGSSGAVGTEINDDAGVTDAPRFTDRPSGNAG